jgi:hypothetical protein
MLELLGVEQPWRQEEEEGAGCPIKVSRVTKSSLGLQVSDSNINMVNKHKFSH